MHGSKIMQIGLITLKNNTSAASQSLSSRTSGITVGPRLSSDRLHIMLATCQRFGTKSRVGGRRSIFFHFTLHERRSSAERPAFRQPEKQKAKKSSRGIDGPQRRVWVRPLCLNSEKRAVILLYAYNSATLASPLFPLGASGLTSVIFVLFLLSLLTAGGGRQRPRYGRK